MFHYQSIVWICSLTIHQYFLMNYLPLQVFRILRNPKIYILLRQ
ncbi:hypothetical protein AC77_1782 [Escherichia coli 5-366-08_S4_C1]|nr:hypothetical protein AC77_1782 [Escherichia coli 5-366-08_S4_C1]